MATPKQPDRLTGAQVAALREALGWTQTEMANALGVTQARISDFERGARQVPRPVSAAARAVANVKRVALEG